MTAVAARPAEMMAAARRAGDLEGSPRVTVGTPASFFAQARAELADPAVWSGEMYLEFHRGTYTSQARTKQGNRRSEHLLREAELWSATATARGLLDYPYDELEEIWHVVLLQQFHDILPGSSIAWVHHEAERHYARGRPAARGDHRLGPARTGGDGVGDDHVQRRAGPVGRGRRRGRIGPRDGPRRRGSGRWRRSPPTVAGCSTTGSCVRCSTVTAWSPRSSTPRRDATSSPRAHGSGCCSSSATPPTSGTPGTSTRPTKNVRTDLVEAESVVVDGGALVVTRRVGDSTIVQRWWLDDGEGELHVQTEVDWHERQKLLKLAFPLDVHADRAASEVQFGHVQRPTHQNTSWDFARFETVAHRWGARRRARLRRGRGERRHLRPRHHAEHPRHGRGRRRRHDDARAPVAAAGTDVPRPARRPGAARAALVRAGRAPTCSTPRPRATA